jgi:tetratricopeptide (TPR) repeat protein
MNLNDKPGRNDPCPCGSGRKYKKCCGQVEPVAPAVLAARRAPAAAASHRRAQPGAVPPAEVSQLVALLAAGRYVELERMARQLTARHPASGLAWKALGISLKMQAKDPLAALERAAELMPLDAEAHGNLGIALLEVGRIDEAMARFRRALQIKPDYAEAHNVVGNVLLDRGRPEEAAASYRSAIAAKPGYADAHNNLGNALLHLRRVDEAAGSYRRALEIRPDYAEVHNNLGNALIDLGQLEEATASYRRALELKPDFAEAHGSLGNALLQLGRLEEAVASYQRALALQPNNPKLHSSLGNALLHLKRPEDAVASCRRALAIKPDFAEAHSNLGNALLDLGRFEEAAASYQRALEVRPNYSEVHNNLGNLLRSLGRYDEAVASYRRALAIKPDYAEVHNNLAVVLRLQRRTAEAEESCRKALELNPNSAATMATLAEAHADKGEFSEAEALFKRALSLQPELAEAWAGIVRVRKMTPEDAFWLAGAQRLVQQSLRPREAISLQYALGKYFDDLRDFDQAFLHYQRANELTKQHADRADRYDRQRLTQAVDRLIDSYDRNWIDRARAFGVASRRPVFIVGMPRSGTSLVEQILASHRQVFGAGELLFWSAASNVYQSSAREGELIASVAGRLANDYLRLLQELSAEAVRVIDKMPGNFMYLGLIHAALPDARIIHMRRDPIDTCLSIYFQDFGSVLAYANDLGDLAHYYAEYRRIMRHWQSILPGNALLDVPYEGLIDDQEAWSRRMLEFIELPWDPHCLDFHETRRSVVTTSRWQVRQKISRSSVARWRNYEQYVGPLLELL